MKCNVGRERCDVTVSVHRLPPAAELSGSRAEYRREPVGERGEGIALLPDRRQHFRRMLRIDVRGIRIQAVGQGGNVVEFAESGLNVRECGRRNGVARRTRRQRFTRVAERLHRKPQLVEGLRRGRCQGCRRHQPLERSACTRPRQCGGSVGL